MKLIKSELRISAAQASFLKRCAEFGDLNNDFLEGMEIKATVGRALICKGLATQTEGRFVGLTEKGKEAAKALAAMEYKERRIMPEHDKNTPNLPCLANHFAFPSQGLSLGLTKREFFAAMAMQGLCANSEISDLNDADIADIAVGQAEELVKRLNKQE